MTPEAMREREIEWLEEFPWVYYDPSEGRIMAREFILGSKAPHDGFVPWLLTDPTETKGEYFFYDFSEESVSITSEWEDIVKFVNKAEAVNAHIIGQIGKGKGALGRNGIRRAPDWDIPVKWEEIEDTEERQPKPFYQPAAGGYDWNDVSNDNDGNDQEVRDVSYKDAALGGRGSRGRGGGGRGGRGGGRMKFESNAGANSVVFIL